MVTRKTYGTFVKVHPETGQPVRRTAFAPEEAVALRFDGWREESARAVGGEAGRSSGQVKPTPEQDKPIRQPAK